jgi:hypothetical protein
MKKIILTLSLLMLISLTSFGQKKRTSSIILTQQETANLFTDSLKKQLGINYPIRSVYKCKDKSGIFLHGTYRNERQHNYQLRHAAPQYKSF